MSCEDAKLARLRQTFRGLAGVAVAYSGGVDSAVVLKIAREELGERAVAVMNVSPLTPPGEAEEAVRTARAMGAEPIITHADPLEDETFRSGPEDRCYRCKRAVFAAVAAVAREKGADTIVDGSQVDDLGEDRPGRRALAEAGVRSPLIEAGLRKEEVRELARRLSVPAAERPASPCLVTRIPFHEEVTLDKLRAVGRAEEALRGLGAGTVRVRHHGTVARVEVPAEDIPLVVRHRERVVEELKRLGFTYVTVDLQGFRSGSMAEALPGRRRTEDDGGNGSGRTTAQGAANGQG